MNFLVVFCALSCIRFVSGVEHFQLLWSSSKALPSRPSAFLLLLKFYIFQFSSLCSVAKMDFPAELDDPTLTADGTKCGDNKVISREFSTQCIYTFP